MASAYRLQDLGQIEQAVPDIEQHDQGQDHDRADRHGERKVQGGDRLVGDQAGIDRTRAA